MKLRTSKLAAAFALVTTVNLVAAEHYDVQIERGAAVKGVTRSCSSGRPTTKPFAISACGLPPAAT